MAIIKGELIKKINDTPVQLYPTTSADNVVYDSNNTVEDKLNAIETTLTAHAVTNKGSAFVSGLYKITTNSEGHVTAATPVTKSDITGLGIPASDTDTTYSAGTGLSLSGTTFSNAAPNVKSDWNAAVGTDAEILNKPTLGAAAAKDVGTDSNQVAAGNHNHSGVYAPASHTHDQADIAGLDTALGGKQNALTAGDNITIATVNGVLTISADTPAPTDVQVQTAVDNYLDQNGVVFNTSAEITEVLND